MRIVDAARFSATRDRRADRAGASNRAERQDGSHARTRWPAHRQPHDNRNPAAVMDLPALERPYSNGSNSNSNGWKPPQQPAVEAPISFSQPTYTQPAAAATAFPPSLSLSAPVSRPSSKELDSLCLRLELSGVLSDRPRREQVALLAANSWALDRAVDAFFREEQARAEEEEDELFNEIEEKSNGSGSGSGVKEEPHAGGPASAAAAASSSQAASFVTPARVNITVRSDSGESQLYADVNSSKSLAKLMSDFISRIARRRCEFFVRGKLVSDSDTPASLAMAKSETMEARAPARAKRTFQVAGGSAEPSAAMVAAAESLKASAAAASSNGASAADPTSKRSKSEIDSSPGSAAAAAAASSATAVPAAPAFRASWHELPLGSVDFWILQDRSGAIDEKGNFSQCPPTMLVLSSFVREFKAQHWSASVRRRHPDVVREEAEAIGADVVQSQQIAEVETRAKQKENSAIVEMLKPLSMHSQSLRGSVMLINSIAGCECANAKCPNLKHLTYHQMRVTLALLPGAHDDIIPFGNRLMPLICPELAPLIETALPSAQPHPDRAQVHSLLDLSVRTQFKYDAEARPDPKHFLMEVEDAMDDEEEKKSEAVPAAAAAAAASSSSSSSAAAAAPAAAPVVHQSEFDRLRSDWGLPVESPEEDLSGPATDPLLHLSDRDLSARCKLSVTLRDYQQQTVLWALKQETGVCSISDAYWVTVEIGKQRVWYSPYLQAIRFLPPPEVHGGLISEEMGLGKTVEMLALIHLNPAKATTGPAAVALGAPLPPHSASRPAGLVPARSTLIIAPTSLIGQWYSEIDKRSAGEKLSTLCWYGSSRTQDVNKISSYDVVLTTFGILAAELDKQNKKNAAAAAAAGPAEISPLHRIDFHRIIVDESHSLKSRVSKQSRNVLTLQSPRKWLLSGTPISLQIDDLFHQFAFFGMPVLNDAPILNAVRYHAFGLKHEARVDEFRPLEAFGLLRQILQRTVMRHRKMQKFNGRTELIALPPRHMDTIKVEFTPEERAGYDKMFEFARSRFQDLSNNRRSLAGQSFQLLSLLSPIRQACSAGHHDLNELLASLAAIQQREEEGRIEAAAAHDASIKLNLAQQAFNDGQECSICLDIIEDALMTLCRHQYCRECILQLAAKPGSHECPLCRQLFTKKDLIKPAPRMEIKPPEEKAAAAAASSSSSSSSSLASVPSHLFFSSKIDALLVQLLRLRALDPSKKSLVFSQFTQTLGIVQERLSKEGFGCAVIKGNMTAAARKNALEHFINDPHCTVFVMSIRAGSVGLTLTAATEVFVLEPSMNPAVTQQAINRVHRVGQTKPVHIHHLIMAGSIEERIMQITQAQLQQRGDEEDSGAAAGRGVLIKDTAHMRAEQLVALFA